MKREDHVSTFELDLHFASGKPADSAVEGHLATCTRCRAYVSSLDALSDAASARADAPGAGLRTAGTPPALSRPRWRVPSALAAGLALAAGVFFWMRARPGTEDYVGAKGSPAVQVLVHRGVATWVWDGRTPILPGDALALEVACEGLDHVTVASPTGAGWTRIKEVDCPASRGALPFTLVADDAPGSESFDVVLSHGAVSDAALQSAIAENRHAADVWVDAFVLPKAPGNDR